MGGPEKDGCCARIKKGTNSRPADLLLSGHRSVSAETALRLGQLRRAACSVPANIIEGSARESKKDYLHVLYIARALPSETQHFIHLARRLGCLADAEANQMHAQAKIAFACLHALTRAGEKEAGKFAGIARSPTSPFALAEVPRSRRPLFARFNPGLIA